MEVQLETRIWDWVDNVIIGEQFCPFAKVPREKGSIKLHICTSKKIADILETIAQECKFLDDNASTETTLIACSQALYKFDDYLDVLDMANSLLEDLGYMGTYQLASFHPEYQFEGEPADSTSHFTNRSIVPIFHLIREASITLALQFVDNPDDIPLRNIDHASSLGRDFFTPYLVKKLQEQ